MKSKLVFFGSFNKSMFEYLHTDHSKPHPSLMEDWIKYRFKIWEKYTWNSIKNQYREDWNYVLCCHADTKDLIKETFKGIYDNRLVISYTDGEKEVIEGLSKDCDEVIMCRIDSDDMYHPAVADIILSSEDRPEWAYFPKGYVLRLKWLELNEWSCHGVGPFFYHRYKAEDFAKRDKIEELPHRWVMKHNPTKLRDGMFMVTLHEKNTSSGIHCANVGQRLGGSKEIDVFRNFGVKP